MMYIDPKDIPFAGFMTWSLYYLVRMARRYPHVPASLIVKMGIAAGCALGVRVGGMLALCYMVPVLMVAAWRHEGYRLRPTLVSITTRMPVIIVATILVTWLVMLPFWPWAQLDPIHHPFEAFLHFRDDADNDIDTLFLGQQVGPENRPHLYLPVYLAVKSPDILLLLLAAGLGLGLFGLWRQRRGLARAEFLTPTLTALLFSSVFPILYALITSPALYDAERHFLFVMPGFAALAAVAARAMARRLAQPSGAALPVRPWARNAWAGACAVLMTYQAGQMIALHPFEYTFYNDTIGGLPGADGRFETEYWGSSLDAALHDLITHIEASGEATAGGAPMTVWVCGNSDLIEPQLPPYLHLADDLSRADFYLSTTRHGCDKEVDGPIVSKIGRRGVNFAVVKDIRSQLAHQTPSSEEPAGQ